MINIPMKMISYINNQIVNGKDANIIIAGCSCSGKTTLSNEIVERLDGKGMQVNVIHEDSYFKDIEDIPKSSKGVLADSIDAFYGQEFVDAAISLVNKGIAYIPDYDLSVNKRKSSFTKIQKGNINVNVFEGLHSIEFLDGKLESLKVFLDTPLSTCLQRRIERDKKDWSIAKPFVERYWNECIAPISTRDVLPQKNKADFLIIDGGIL